MSMDVTLILAIPEASMKDVVKKLLETADGEKLVKTLAYYSGSTIRVRINKRIARPNSPDRERIPDLKEKEAKAKAAAEKAEAKAAKKAAREAKAGKTPKEKPAKKVKAEKAKTNKPAKKAKAEK